MPKKQIQWGNIPMKGEEYADKLSIRTLNLLDNVTKESCSKGGKIGGNKNKKSGHIQKIQKENAHIGGSIQGKIQGKKNVENEFWKNLTFEQRSKGGKTSGKDRVNDGTLLKASKIGAKISTERRIENALEKYKCILKFIRKKQFTLSDMKNACEKFGITGDRIAAQAKKILKEKSLVKQIHKGYNQFNPSLYIKVK